MTTRGDIAATVAPRLGDVARSWSSGPFPSLLLLVCGAALGPHGLSIVSAPVLLFLDPAAPVGIAVFGIIAAMRRPAGRASNRDAAAAGLEATITGLVVAAAFIVMRPAVSSADLFPAWGTAALVLGIAAAASSSLAWARDESDPTPRADVEDAIVPIIAGGVLLAVVREPVIADAALLTAHAIAIAVVVAVSGWLLLARASTTEEQRVATFACVLLLGGAADYLSMSALLCGAVAGTCWRRASAPVREHIRRDVTYAAHSLLALVLLLAGAHADYSPAALAIAVGYTVVRATGKLAGASIAARLFPASPRRATRLLLAPGAFGVAFALNVVRVLGPEYAAVLTVVVVGTIASSLIAAIANEEENA